MTSVLWLLASALSASAAVPTYYTDRFLFEAATTPGFVIEDYADPAYVFIQSDAIMSAVLGETDYETTGFGNLNIVQNNDTYCAGCNGSYRLSFTTTSLSLPGAGITNVGVDIVANDAGTPYHAYVEYGDGTFDDYPLPVGASFFGIVEYQSTVISIHMGLANGGTTTGGSFVIDNLTVGNSCSGIGPDADGDGVEDDCDNCPADINAGQDDNDSDGDGDVCDICPFDADNDIDGDGLCADVDPCPLFSDLLDADGDTVADGCDICPAGDDLVDTDLDLVPDDCDLCPGSDDRFDDDGDGLPDGCDVCPNGSDVDDGDADGVADGCDNCQLDSNPLQDDTDGDDVGDICDQCPGFDDSFDADSDRVPDDCDNCPMTSNDLQTDTDNDGSGDSCDICPGSDDQIDVDYDGVPDGCDICPGSDDNRDADGDGVPDGCDVCAAGDDNDDGDGDGVANACDPCPFDDPDDSDLDGVCDRDDMCPGVDDSIDGDGDGFPDDCDDCPTVAQPALMDEDGDGYGRACDCDDTVPTIYPDAAEVCDGLDNDCDEQIDEDALDAQAWYADTDADGEGTADDVAMECDPPNGRVDNQTDCDDNDAAINTLALEICDEIDNDCDGAIDENLTDCVEESDKTGEGCSCDTNSSSPFGAAWLVLIGSLLLRRREP